MASRKVIRRPAITPVVVPVSCTKTQAPQVISVTPVVSGHGTIHRPVVTPVHPIVYTSPRTMLPSKSGMEPSASANSVKAIFGKGFNFNELRISY